MKRPDRCIIISGGASHGPTLWGALMVVLGEYNTVGIGGASIGAVKAAGIAVGLPLSRLEEEMVTLFQNNALTGGAKMLRFHPRIFWSRGGGLHDWSHVVKHLRRIFGDLKMADAKIPLCIVVGDVYTGEPTYVTSWGNPDALIWQVLAASTAVWPVADAQTIPSLGTGNRLYVDGGWGNNVPSQVFEGESAPTITLYLSKPDRDRDGRTDATKRQGVLGVIEACLELSLHGDPDVHGRKDDLAIPIEPEGSGFDFDLTAAEIRKRVLNGAMQARLALQRYKKGALQ
jgi:predicted acylesterase/phospholipase RssA